MLHSRQACSSEFAQTFDAFSFLKKKKLMMTINTSLVRFHLSRSVTDSGRDVGPRLMTACRVGARRCHKRCGSIDRRMCCARRRKDDLLISRHTILNDNRLYVAVIVFSSNLATTPIFSVRQSAAGRKYIEQQQAGHHSHHR